MGKKVDKAVLAKLQELDKKVAKEGAEVDKMLSKLKAASAGIKKLKKAVEGAPGG